MVFCASLRAKAKAEHYQELEVIRLTNYHVRNSLQVISFAASVPQQEEFTNEPRGAVERIEWAQWNVLPDEREDFSELFVFAHPDESVHKPRIVFLTVSLRCY